MLKILMQTNTGDGCQCEDGGDDGGDLESDGRHEQDDEPTAGEDVCDQYWISLLIFENHTVTFVSRWRRICKTLRLLT